MMRKTLLFSFCVLIATSGCARLSDSRLNPFNWFGQAQAAPTDADGNLRPLVPAGALDNVVDSRGLIASVTGLTVDRTPDGAIVTARGLAETQGAFNAQLVPVGTQDGILTLGFRVQIPEGFEAISSVASRQITAAFVLTQAQLLGLRGIQVQAQGNSLISRR